MRPARLQRSAQRGIGLAETVGVVIDEKDQALDAGTTEESAEAPLETADQAGRSGAPR